MFKNIYLIFFLELRLRRERYCKDVGGGFRLIFKGGGKIFFVYNESEIWCCGDSVLYLKLGYY